MAIRIYLLGFMGAGKTYTGHRLARRLDFDFLDLDTFIEEAEGASIPVIFSTKGEDYFRETEARCLRETGQFERVVIATGGGTPCYFGNLEWMNENGVTIFLDTSEDILCKRLINSNKRPLVANKTTSGLTEFITRKLSERRPFYEGTHLCYETRSPVQKVAEDLFDYLVRFVHR